MTLATLHDYHARIAAAGDRIEQIVRAPGPDVGARLNGARMMMAQVMGSYQLFLHREIFEPLSRSEDARTAGQARDLKAECIVFAADLHGYMTSWNPSEVAACWPDYRAAALAILARIRGNMKRVDRLCGLLLPPDTDTARLPAAQTLRA